MSVAATLPCECPECKQISRSLRRKSVCIIMIENLRNVLLFKIPIFSVYEFRLFFKKIPQVGGKAESGLQKHSSQLWQFTTSARCFQENRERQSRNRRTETKRECVCVCMCVCVLVFGGDLGLRLIQLVFILFPETVSGWEKFPAPFLIHLPNIRFL